MLLGKRSRRTEDSLKCCILGRCKEVMQLWGFLLPCEPVNEAQELLPDSLVSTIRGFFQLVPQRPATSTFCNTT